MPELNSKHVEAVINVINQGPFFKHLSMFVIDMGIGHALVELDMGKKHLNPFGGIHGGVYASAIDTAAYWAVYCELDEDAGMISVDLKIDYLAPAKSGKLTIKGRSIKIGKTICLAEASATDENGKWLAHGTSKMMVTHDLQTIRNAIDVISLRKLPPKFV